MGVDQRDLAFGRFADVRDDILAADRVIGDQFGHWRVHRRPGIDENAATRTFEEGHAEAIGMVTGAPAAVMETSKRKADVSRNIAVHSQQLAHFLVCSPVSPLTGAILTPS